MLERVHGSYWNQDGSLSRSWCDDEKKMLLSVMMGSKCFDKTVKLVTRQFSSHQMLKRLSKEEIDYFFNMM